MYSHSLDLLSLSNNRKKSLIPNLQILESREVPAGNLIASFNLDNAWGSGMQGNITIKNTGDAPVTNWSATFDYSNTIQSSWNGTITQVSVGKFKINNAGWNSTIAPGASVSVGFIGGGNYAINPANFTFSGDGLSVLPSPRDGLLYRMPSSA